MYRIFFINSNMHQHSPTASALATGLIIAVTLWISSCSSTPPSSPSGRTEVKLPFADHQSDDEAFRGVGVGRSPDRGFALEQAKLDARTTIAQEVRTSVKSALERYREETQSTRDTVDNSEGSRVEELTLNLVDQTLNNTQVEQQRMFELNEGDRLLYEAHVAVTLRRRDLVDALEERHETGDASAPVEYDPQKFRQAFEQEIERLRQEEDQE